MGGFFLNRYRSIIVSKFFTPNSIKGNLRGNKGFRFQLYFLDLDR